jgi:photosystem II stability/assembly factor-like uncharacterized protein
MIREVRTRLMRWLGVLGMLACGGTASADSPSQELTPPDARSIADPACSEPMRADARLSDVCFVDRDHGWAVGDRGTIWHSDDGGRNWGLQRADVPCRLHSVFFLNLDTGWAAGGCSLPYTGNSSGVVLFTHDGGQHWIRDPKLLLPALKQVRFSSERHGWAVGCPSAMFPSGVFVTEDGGRNWNPLPSARTSGWSSGDFLAPYQGVVAGHGAVAVAHRAGLEPSRTLDFGLRSLARLKLVPPSYGWLVGQGGLVMLTGDSGASWHLPPAPLPEGVIAEFDFNALEVRGTKVWIAGVPGSRILHSPDAGHTWLLQPTGQSLPIHAISFADDTCGWAVGDLGTILATTDGGQTWNRQRSGGARAALLGVFGDPQDVPFEVFARLSGNEGYLGQVEIIGRRDLETPSRTETSWDDRFHEAMIGVGASGAGVAWQFPLRQPGLELSATQIVAGWDAVNDHHALEQLEAYLVRQIRLWRPDVLLTKDPSSAGVDPLAELVGTAVAAAAIKAEDPSAFNRQITLASLSPWKVKRIYAATRPGVSGTINLATSQLAPRLGRSLADVAATPRGLVSNRCQDWPASIGLRLVQDESSDLRPRKDFFAGISLSPGSDARRLLDAATLEGLESARRLAQHRRSVQAVLERAGDDPRQGMALAAQLGEMVRGLDPASAAETLYHVGQRCYQAGRWPLAAEAFKLLADQFPEHPLSRPATIWLVQYYASSEAAWREQGSRPITVGRIADPSYLSRATSAATPGGTTNVDPQVQSERLQKALALAAQIQRSRPDLMAEPTVGFPLAAVDRRRGELRQAERFYSNRIRLAGRDCWWAAAMGEQWAAHLQGTPPKPLLECVPASVRPRLDGRLDDPVWQVARPVELHSPPGDDAGWPASVMLAYDNQFLYLAIRCRQAPGVRYEPASGPRTRDADLSRHDRVEIYLDLDRNFVTYDRLTIDHRGFTGDDCWGDATWNPNWFVACSSADGFWTAEAAIPWDQLAAERPKPNSVWAIGVQRIVPGVGFQSWNRPAAIDVMPEGFGYLLFR